MRERLTWARGRTAFDKTADPNQLGREDRVNPPISKYEIYDFTPGHPLRDERTQWKEDTRLETGHPSPARYAARRMMRQRKKLARELEAKASKCIRIAEALFPDAEDDVIEEQALDLMDMRDDAIHATLERISQNEDEEESAYEAAKRKKKPPEEKPPEEEAAELEAARKRKKKPEVEEEVAVDEDEEEEKEAASGLDIELQGTQVFTEEVQSDDILDELFTEKMPKGAKELLKKKAVKKAKKKGVKSIKGVRRKEASAQDQVTNLSKLWKTAPDVSSVFE